ncbi:MAG: IS30 family transposase [Flavobacterium sp.]|nr:MAG: IS30 family transposase [Flavobacterium sp.]
MEKKRRRLRLEERVVIQTLLAEKRSIAYIAERLGRNRSSIHREVKKWVVLPKDKYKAELAQFCAREEYLNKRNLDKISSHQRLKQYVYARLEQKDSPEQIAGRLKELFPDDPIMSISHEAIYQHIYKKRQSKLGKYLISLLPYSHSQRRQNRKVAKKKNRIADIKRIDLRPAHIELRQEIGHWESDLVIGREHKSAIATLVERKTRFVYIVPVKSKHTKIVTKAIASTMKKLEPQLRKTMTHDNGTEMANHKWLTNKTGLEIYFANPYSSWERGTNENTNGLIRRFFPKGTDFSKVTRKQLTQAQNNLNNRPRKVLGYKTPNEMMQLENFKLNSNLIN